MTASSLSNLSDLMESSESDAKSDRKKIKQENFKLIQENSDLSNKLNSVKKQFNETMDITSKFEMFFARDVQNQKEISKLKLENHDLQRRLDIALKNFQELQCHQKAENQTFIDSRIIEINEQMSCMKQKHDQEIKNLTKQYECKIECLKRQLSEAENFKMQMEPVFEKATCYFKQCVNSPKSLLKCINSKLMCEPDLEKLAKTIRKQKRIIEKYRSMEDDYQSEIDRLSSQCDSRSFELSQQIEDLKERNSQQTRQIDELSQSNEKLLKEISKQSARLKLNSLECETNEFCGEPLCLVRQLGDVNKQIISLAKLNKRLKKKLENTENKLDKSERRCKDLASKICSLESTYKGITDDYDSRCKYIAELESKYRSSENALSRSKADSTTKNEELSSLKIDLKRSNDELNHLQQINRDLLREKNELSTTLQKTKAELESFRIKTQAAEDSQREFERKLIEAQSKLKQAMDTFGSGENIPSGIFVSSEFPRDLQNVLREVSHNNSYNLATKLSDAFSIIAKWYRNKCDQLESEVNAEHQKYSMLRSQVDALLDFLKKMFPEAKINFDLIITDDATRGIFGESIVHLRDLANAKVKLDNQLNDIYETFQVKELPELKEAVFKNARQIDKLNQANEILKQKLKKLQHASALKQRELDHALRTIEDQYDNVSKTCDQLENNKSELQAQIGVLEQEKLRHKMEIDQLSRNELKNIRDEYDKKVSMLQKENATLQFQVKSLQEMKDNYESENSNLNELINKMRKRKDRLELRVKELQEHIDEGEKNHKEKVKFEKGEAQKRYESLMSQTKTQNADFQDQIKKLSMKVAQLEETNNSLMSQNTELTLKNQKLDTCIAALRAECERDKKNLESQYNAKLSSLQNDYRRQIDEVKSQIDIERRRVTDALSRNFSTMVDGIRIDAGNIESVAVAIKRKYDDLIRKEALLRKNINKDHSYDDYDDASYRISHHRRRNAFLRF